MDWYWILLIVLGSLVFIAEVFAFIFAFTMTRGRRNTYQDHINYCIKYGYQYVFPKMVSENINFTLSDGYVIHGEYIPVENSKGLIISVHGHMASRESNRKYADLFNEMGYSVIIYDQRGHGDNVRTYVTMGYRESVDLAEIVKQVRVKFGNDIFMGLHGESMGAATVTMCAKYKPDVAFIIEDCGYSSLKELVYDISKQNYTVVFYYAIRFLLNVTLKITSGFGYSTIRPIDAVKDTNIPMMFIHGAKDTYVFPKHSKMMYDACKSKKKIVIFDNAKHAKSIYSDREKYIKSIGDFIEELEA